MIRRAGFRFIVIMFALVCMPACARRLAYDVASDPDPFPAGHGNPSAFSRRNRRRRVRGARPLTPRSTPFLFGHDAAEATFDAALAAGRMHHAWFVTGPPSASATPVDAYGRARSITGA